MAIKRRRWRFCQHAPVAVDLVFRPGSPQFPALPGLVKYYVDLLKSRVFSEDKQVQHLTASCSSPIGGFSVGEVPGFTILFVQRLARYDSRLELYYRLLEIQSFREFYCANNPALCRPVRADKARDSVERKLEFWRSFGLPENTIEWIARVTMLSRVLSHSQIGPHDRPRPGDAFGMESQQGDAALGGPLEWELGTLPERDECRDWRLDIRKNLMGRPWILPRRGDSAPRFDVDVLVRSRATLTKDLDNVISDIYRTIGQDLLGTRRVLPSFRIYHAPIAQGEVSGPTVRMKLLPFGAIADFGFQVGWVLDAGKQWLVAQLGQLASTHRARHPGVQQSPVRCAIGTDGQDACFLDKTAAFVALQRLQMAGATE